MLSIHQEINIRNRVTEELVRRRPKNIKRVCSTTPTPYACFLVSEQGNFYEPDLEHGILDVDFNLDCFLYAEHIKNVEHIRRCLK